MGADGAARASAVAWLGIAVVAIALRFRNLGWGEGPIFDEVVYWRVPLLAFVPPGPSNLLAWGLNYPTLYGYLAGATVGVAHALGFVPAAAGRYFDVVVIARGVSAAAGVASVLLVGVAGRRAGGRVTGLVAAMLLAVVPIEVTQTHYVSVDVLQNVFIVLALIAACGLLQRERARDALLGGIAAGLAFSTKYNAAAILVAPSWAALEVALRRRSLWILATFGACLTLGFVAAVAAGCPACLVRWDEMLATISFHSRNSFLASGGSYGATLSPEIGWFARPYLYQLVAGLTFALGWPLYLLALAGVVAAVLRRSAVERMLLATTVTLFVILGGPLVVYLRYLLPLVPPLVIMAALAFTRLASRHRAWWLLLAAVVLYSAALAWSLVGRYSHRQQEAVATWLAEQTARCRSAGVRLVVGHPSGSYFGLWGAIARHKEVEQIAPHIGQWFDAPPDVFVVPDWYAINIGLKRMPGGATLEGDLARLRDPNGEYAPVAHWSSSYLQKGFYTRLDPSFDATLEQGELGFTAYARRSLGCVERRTE